MMNRMFSVELYEREGVQEVFISTDGASGASYKVGSLDEVGCLVTNYIKDYENEEK